jgi:hypothetical protein
LLIRKTFLLVAIILMLPSSVIGMDNDERELATPFLQCQQLNTQEPIIDMDHPSDQTLTSQMNTENDVNLIEPMEGNIRLKFEEVIRGCYLGATVGYTLGIITFFGVLIFPILTDNMILHCSQSYDPSQSYLIFTPLGSYSSYFNLTYILF